MKIILLLIGHFCGDYFFQNNEMASKKRTDTKFFLLHSSIYFICIFVCSLFWGNIYQILMISIVVGFTHSLVDGLRVMLKKENLMMPLYFLDQLLHIGVLFFLSANIIPANFIGKAISGYFDMHFKFVTLRQAGFVLLCYLFCMHPVGITVKLILSNINVEDGKQSSQKKSDNQLPTQDNGFIIGILERFCILTLAILGQFTAISFVIAAKSLARLKRLEDQDFAEKYLVGTFLSVLVALLCGCAVRICMHF